MNILHIDTSINGDKSASRRISAQAVQTLKAQYPGANLTYRDLAAAPLSHLTLDQFTSPDSGIALGEFKDADIIVIGAGMYNFTVPSQLKAWIDRIVIPDQTFRYGKAGPEGLVNGKRVIVGLARGGHYGEGTPAASMEHAETYLRSVFVFLGITDVTFVNADGTDIPGARETAIEGAEQRAAALAA